MKKKDLIERFYDMEAIEAERRRLGEYNAESAVIITLCAAMKDVMEHLIEVYPKKQTPGKKGHGKIVRPKKK